MLTIFFGNDTVGARARAHEYIETVRTDGGEVVTLSADGYTKGELGARAEASSLFGGTEVVLIDTFSENAEAYEDLLTLLPDLAASVHHFVVLESTLLAAQKKQFSKHAGTMEECMMKAPERFNTFGLVDALLRKDKRELWVLLIKARQSGVGDEEIIGVLLWQLKMLRLAAVTESPEEAGQKPFAYHKAKRALGALSQGECVRLTKELLALYHEGHMGKRDLSLGLEQFVLSL